MRTKFLAIIGLSFTAVTELGSFPASAVEYPYCVQGGGYGVPGDCSYQTIAQCVNADRILTSHSSHAQI